MVPVLAYPWILVPHLLTIAECCHDRGEGSVVNVAVVAHADDIHPKGPDSLALLDAQILEVQNIALLQHAVDRLGDDLRLFAGWSWSECA